MHVIDLEEKYKDASPNALDLFKETHCSKKEAFTPILQSVIAEMEMKLAEPVEDGCQPKSADDVVAQVLAAKTKKNKFLVNVGINKSSAADSSAGSRRELQEALVSEQQTSADLRDLVNIQRQQLDEMVKKMQAQEEERAKKDEEAKQRQAETDTLLRRLMAMIPSNQP